MKHLLNISNINGSEIEPVSDERHRAIVGERIYRKWKVFESGKFPDAILPDVRSQSERRTI